ncbi:MAG: cytochrome c peroxidase, partial [Flavobacteriales bacterium]
MRVALFILIAFVAVAFGFQPAPKWPPRVYEPSPVQQQENCIQLGRALFYDPILSRDSTISCASCHSSYVAFTHVDHPVSH